MGVNPHRRLWAESVDLTLDLGEGHHFLTVSLAFDRPPWDENGRGELREIAFVGRGKVGGGIDILLHDLGIQLSRAIQGRDPDTGAKRETPLLQLAERCAGGTIAMPKFTNRLRCALGKKLEQLRRLLGRRRRTP